MLTSEQMKSSILALVEEIGFTIISRHCLQELFPDPEPVNPIALFADTLHRAEGGSTILGDTRSGNELFTQWLNANRLYSVPDMRNRDAVVVRRIGSSVSYLEKT